MKTIIKIGLIFLFSQQVFGQQEAMVSQYMFNGLYLNPAYAGSHKYFSSTLLGRKQWAGLEGSPESIIASIDGPINNEKMGIGLVLVRDQIGVTNLTDIIANYSYNIKLGQGKLAFGIKVGISQYEAYLTDLKYWDEEDPIYSEDILGEVIPRFGGGAYYYQTKWYVGLSVPTLMAYEKEYGFSSNINNASNLRKHFYLTGGYVFTISKNWKIKPSSLIKYTTAAPLQIDLNANLLYNDMIWFGVSYRSGDSFIGIIEYQANPRFRIGYAHDFSISEIRNHSSETHEIMIGYDFGKDFIKVKSPRFF